MCYDRDCRVIAGRRDKPNFDAKRMLLFIPLNYEDEEGNEAEETVVFPAIYKVCPTCSGKGKHVNPSIDADGLTAEDFDEDPDFRESYFSGVYDVTCYECGGLRVIPEIDESNLSEAQKGFLTRVQELEAQKAQWAREEAAERRMGY